MIIITDTQQAAVWQYTVNKTENVGSGFRKPAKPSGYIKSLSAPAVPPTDASQVAGPGKHAIFMYTTGHN